MTKAWLIAAVSVATLSAAGGAGMPLIDAVKSGNRSAVRTLIAQKGTINLAEPDGMTALHWAVAQNNLPVIDLLLKAGANVKAANRYGVTPLHLAASNANAAIVERLLQAGADAKTAAYVIPSTDAGGELRLFNKRSR